jgi:type IV secretory pathway VirB2 component (pilin)
MLKKLRKNVVALGALALAAVIGISNHACAAVTLPDMPIDFTDYATAGMTVVGTVLGAIAGIVVVVALVKMGLQKLSGAFNGRA